VLRSKSDFLADLAHEIRTPLNTILAMADLLSELSIPGEGKRFLDAMIAGGNTLLDLVYSVSDLDKIETGRIDLESGIFDVEELIDYVMGSVAAKAHRKGLEIIGKVERGVPRRIIGDPLRTRQILLNLVCNAIESTESGEVRLTVENTSEAANPQSLRFTITDTRNGIPQERLNEIVRSFSETSERLRPRLITGQGFSIVTGLLELMDRHTRVQSELGKRTHFQVCGGIGNP
jgi:two-component system sensor histidine kinase/response regulator